MAFNEDVKIRAMVACGRRCCICHKFCGNNMEVHHIKAHADGGDDSFDNAIPLCFDCHAIVRQYDPKHPKGIKFTAKELILHRDSWYEKVKQGVDKKSNNGADEKVHTKKIQQQKEYQNIILYKANEGKDIITCINGACGIAYDEETKTLEEAKLVGEFLQYIKDLLDIDDFLDEPSDRVMTSFNLTESIAELEQAGFWVFVGVDNKRLIDRQGSSEEFPILIIRVVRKDSSEIIKK